MSKLDSLYFQVAMIMDNQPLPDSKKHLWAKIDDKYIVWFDKSQIKDLILELIGQDREWDTTEPYDNPDMAQGYNEAKDELREKVEKL